MDILEWQIRCSARLHARWPTLAREQRDEVAHEIAADERFRQLDPEVAAVRWLQQGLPDAGQERFHVR